MLPKLKGTEKIFLSCPKENGHVEAVTVCVDCSYFVGFICPKIQGLKKRLSMNEITQEYLEENVETCREQPKLWYVQCNFPVYRQCNVLYTKGEVK